MRINWSTVRQFVIGGLVCGLACPGCTPNSSDDDTEASPTPAEASPTPTAGDDDVTVETSPTPADASPTPGDASPTPGTSDCDILVSPSDDDYTTVQTAFIEAAEGSTVCVAAGTYTFASELSVSTRGITVRGINGPLFDFSGQISGGNGIAITGDDFMIEGIVVLNPAGDGVRATEVNNVTFRGVSVIWDTASSDNGGYGLYPVSSDGVTVEDCVVSGASDAGIYVGQSTNILVMNNEVYENVAGIEIENSTDAEVVGNYAHDNTGGILVFNLPGLPVQDGKRANVHDNVVSENNHVNFAPEGNTVALVPQGTGLMVLASDNNEIHHNEVSDNDSIGFVVVAYTEMLGFPPVEDPEFDAYPEGNYTHDNVFSNNGSDPHDFARQLMLAMHISPPLPALLWDGCVDPGLDGSEENVTNCFSSNGDATYGNLDLCGELVPSYDLSEVTCVYDSLPSQY